jgi:hypothetical protein
MPLSSNPPASPPHQDDSPCIRTEELPEPSDDYRRYFTVDLEDSGKTELTVSDIDRVDHVQVGYVPRHSENPKRVRLTHVSPNQEDSELASISGTPHDRDADQYHVDFELVWRDSDSYKPCPVGKVLYLDIPDTDDT